MSGKEQIKLVQLAENFMNLDDNQKVYISAFIDGMNSANDMHKNKNKENDVSDSDK